MCLICTDFFKPPVIQCVKGHSYCQSCIVRMKNSSSKEKTCAVCRSSISSNIRNYSIEEILSKFSVGCCWASRGCESQIFLNNREEHEQNCQFRPLVDCYFNHQHQCRLGTLSFHKSRLMDGVVFAALEILTGILSFKYLTLIISMKILKF